MALMDIDSAVTTDMDSITYGAGSEPWNKVENAYKIDMVDTDTLTYQSDWVKWHGIYRTVSVMKNTIDKLSMWTVGKGFKADEKTKLLLASIRGIGIDSFNSIMLNNVRTYKISGDSYCEIIRNTAGRLRNLKPLSPGKIVTHANSKGIIVKYEQVVSNQSGEGSQIVHVQNFDPKEIFHLSNCRIADEIHGIPVSESLQGIIKKWENILDVMHVVYIRYVKPLLVMKVSTDDKTEIANIKAIINKSNKEMENIIVPEDVVDIERMSIPQYSTLDPLPWIQMLQSHFIMSTGVPQIILGHSAEASEATAKILYLAFQQTIEAEQLYIEEQIKTQLGLTVNYEFPASIDPSLLTDARKNTGDSVTDLDPSKDKK